MRLVRWLTTAIDAKPEVDREDGDDRSYWWRQAIEEHAQNRDSDLAGSLVGFVREAFEVAIGEAGVPLREALRAIEKRRYLVFRRLWVHLVDVFADQEPGLARDITMDRAYFDDFRFKHEYAVLMGRRFGLLSDAEQANWLSWVWSGPGAEELDDLEGDATTARSDYWRFSHFHWVREHLDGGELKFYQSMFETHGEPELADLHWRVSAGSWGSISPVTPEEFQDRPLEDVVEFVKSWRPTKRGELGPDINGLAGTFEGYIKSNPEEFARRAELLVGCPAIYMRGFLSQIAAAVREGADVELPAILSLASWVLSRSPEESMVQVGEWEPLVDKDWQWTRDQIATLIKTVCEASVDGRPRYSLEGLREELWSILSRLYSGPSASYVLNDEEWRDPRQADFLTLGINSPRGKGRRGVPGVCSVGGEAHHQPCGRGGSRFRGARCDARGATNARVADH